MPPATLEVPGVGRAIEPARVLFPVLEGAMDIGSDSRMGPDVPPLSQRLGCQPQYHRTVDRPAVRPIERAADCIHLVRAIDLALVLTPPLSPPCCWQADVADILGPKIRPVLQPNRRFRNRLPTEKPG